MLLDQQRDVVIVFGLDVLCFFSANAPEIDIVYTSTAAPAFQAEMLRDKFLQPQIGEDIKLKVR